MDLNEMRTELERRKAQCDADGAEFSAIHCQMMTGRIPRQSHIDPDDIADARRERIRQRQYTSAMIHHGDCRDPDHPGCPNCTEESNDE